MSSDDIYIVSPLYLLPGKFGIFHSMGDDDRPSKFYIKDNTVNQTEYSSAVKAVIEAHVINTSSHAEYGVYVNSMALARAQEEIS